MYMALTVDVGFSFTNIFKSVKDEKAFSKIYNNFAALIDVVNGLYVIEDDPNTSS